MQGVMHPHRSWSQRKQLLIIFHHMFIFKKVPLLSRILLHHIL